MKRKTNLFYNNGPDASFLTFSNYTEAMTGNFVSTNTKLYPSKFLCLYIPSLDIEDLDERDTLKKEFINNILCGKYENKLAFLRDTIIEENNGQYKNTYTIESQLSSLAYLLEYIKEYDEDTKIVYVGEISEQDFNGTYTDTICIVDTLYYKNAELIKPEDDEDINSKFYEYYPKNPELQDKIYGWFYTDKYGNIVTSFNFAENIIPSFDDTQDDNAGYNIVSKYSKLKLNNVVTPDTQHDSIEEVKFNILIPLFDIINNDYKSDIVTIQETDEINLLADGKVNKDGVYNAPYISNVPLGIWFSTQQNVTLKRDLKRKYAQTWSLVIGSQFKPFPYMADIPYEISRDSISGAYNTFAQILINQNNVTEKLSDFVKSITDVQQRLANIEKTLHNCPGIDNNMDSLRKEFLDYKNKVENTLNNFTQQLENTELRWVNREG